MKSLKFRPELADMILAGEKTITWRLFDDKDLQTGDQVELLRWDTGEKFGIAHLKAVREKQFKDLASEDRLGHEKFKSDQEMYATYERYYGKPIGPETKLKIIELQLEQDDYPAV